MIAAFIEELFIRSFLLRVLTDPDKWADVPIGTYTLALRCFVWVS
ncbi:MAG: hypothetical protein WBE22_12340 [Halobacteriota archaeon]